MTIKSEISRARYVGNGVTTNFAINFPYLTNNDGTAQVAVYVGNSDTPLVEGKDYTVSGIGAYSDYSGEVDEGLIVYETRYEGGEVIFVNAPADQEPVAIVRDVPQTQGVVFTEGEDFPAQDFENSLDKLTMEVQQIKENLQRAIVLPPTSDEKPLEARDAILAARDEAIVSAKNALVSETNAKESENITVAAKDLIVNDAGVQAIGADLLGENKIGYVAENLDKVADNIDTAVQAATAATEAAQIASDAAANAKATIEAETEVAKESLGDFTDEKIVQINETTNNAVSYVNENAERSRIWAEGEQAEVEPLGGTLSSMGAADLAYAIANAPEDTPIDASGLFAMNVVKGEKGDKGDKGDAGKDGKDGIDGKSIFDGYATNCITEIPQDIKLEINSDGKAVVKAGSKCYFPNEAGKFDVYTVPSDLLYNFSAQTGAYFLAISSRGGAGWATVANAASGTSTAATTSFYYRTDENKIRYKNDTSTTVIYSFPLAIVDVVNGVGTIKQVFNDFGYIGSTVFALPGVKGLMPNGRNADGSLRNEEIVTTNVMTAAAPQNPYWMILNDENGLRLHAVSSTTPYTNSSFWYDEQANILYTQGGSGNLYTKALYFATISGTNAGITSFTPKLPFRAVDYDEALAIKAIASNALTSSDKADIVSWGVPNYSAGYTVSSGFTASKSGVFKAYRNSSYPTIEVKVNNVQVVYFRLEHHYTDQVTYLVRIDKGDVVTFNASTSGTFYPDKGV